MTVESLLSTAGPVKLSSMVGLLIRLTGWEAAGRRLPEVFQFLDVKGLDCALQGCIAALSPGCFATELSRTVGAARS